MSTYNNDEGNEILGGCALIVLVVSAFLFVVFNLSSKNPWEIEPQQYVDTDIVLESPKGYQLITHYKDIRLIDYGTAQEIDSLKKVRYQEVLRYYSDLDKLKKNSKK